MVERLRPKRIVPKRAVRKRLSKSQSMGKTFVQKKKTQKAKEEYSKELSSTAESFVKSLTNLKNIENKINKFYRENRKKINPSFRERFKKQLKSKAKEKAERQNKLIKNLKQNIKKWEQKSEKYEDRAKEKKKKYSSTDARYLREIGNEAEYEERSKAGKDVLKKLKEGEVLDKNKIYKFIGQRGDVAERNAKTKKVSRERRQEFSTKQKKVNEFVEKNVLEQKTPTVKQIKRKLNLDLKNASNVQKSIKENIKKINIAQNKRQAQREKVINDFGSSFVDKLSSLGIKSDVSYDPRVLEKKSGSNLAKLLNLKKEQVQRFNELNPTEKRTLINYSAIVSAKNNLPSDIVALKNFQNIKDLTKNISSIKLPTRELSKRDLKNIKNFRKLSKTEIKNALIKQQNLSQLRDYIDSANKYYSDLKKVGTTRLKTLYKDYFNSLRKQINKTKTPFGSKQLLSSLAKELLIKPTKAFAYAVNLLDISQKLQKNKRITQKEYENYKKSITDLVGAKKLTEKTGKKLNKNFSKGVVKGALLSLLDIGKFVSKTSYRTVEIIVEDVINIGKILNKARIYSFDLKKSFIKDTIEALNSSINKLNKKDKQKFYRRTEEKIKPIIKGVKNITEMIKTVKRNPGLLLIGSVLLLSKGQKSLRKNLIKNPGEVVAQVSSLFLDEYLFLGVGKTAKVLKSTFSPFVLKNVKVFSKTPTIIGTAKTLKKLEGKKIDLFSASKSSLKELLKGFDISKKSEDLLIKEMLKNPKAFIGDNLKIKPLKKIIKNKAQRNVINFMKESKKGILSGSSSLKLQLKKFRNVGDLDIIVKSPKSYANSLAKYLNERTLLGKLTKGKRYKVRKNPNVDGVYTIWDSLGSKKYNKKRALVDVDSRKLFEEDFKDRLGRSFSKKDVRKIGGINVFRVEPQLSKKLIISRDVTKGYRAEKELRDVKLILKEVKKNINKKKFSKVKKILEKEDNVLRVNGQKSFKGAGKDRRWFWVEKYIPDWKKLSEKQIRKKLKKVGFSDSKINKNLNLYSADGFYFAPDVVYSFFTNPKGSIIYLKDQKISKFPKTIQKLIDKNIKGLLNNKEQLKLRKKINQYIKKNPDKVFVGEKILSDRVGEFEIIAPSFSRLFPKKTLFRREIYVPALQKFVKAQEVVLGKRPTSTLKKLYSNFKNKLKKGYKFEDMKKDIRKWAEKKIKNFRESLPSKKESRQLENIRSNLRKEKDFIKKSNLNRAEKKRLTKRINKEIRRTTPENFSSKRRKLITGIKKTINRIRKKTNREELRTKDVVKKIKIRKPKIKKRKTKIKRTPSVRKPKRIKKPKLKPRIRKLKKPKIRIPPIKTFEKIKKIPKAPKIKLSWTRKTPKGQNRLVNGRVRVKGESRIINLKTTPNRALRAMKKYVDKNLARSFELVAIGFTKGKDIKKPDLRKFRIKRTPGSTVLKIVEKSKYAIDTPSEKALLKRARRKGAKKNKNTKVREKGSKRRSGRKKKTSKKQKVRSKQKRSKK